MNIIQVFCGVLVLTACVYTALFIFINTIGLVVEMHEHLFR